MELTVRQLAKRLNARLALGSGKADGCISGLGPVRAADGHTVTFVTSGRHRTVLKNSAAAAVITAEHIEDFVRPQLIVSSVEAALIEVLNIFAPKLKPLPEGIDSTAKVEQDVKIAKAVSIGPGAVIECGVEIGHNSLIGSGCKIGQNTKVGNNCRFDSNVVVYHNCIIGNNVIIQANATIGSTGFGYSFIDGAHRLIPHNGRVVIEDYVEIGANSCIDRAKFGETRIGAGTKIDNLVQIAHNVVIGKCCLIVGQVGIAGSARLGDGVVLAGQSGVGDNLEVGDRVVLGAKSAILSNIKTGMQVWGTPARDAREVKKTKALVKRLPKLVEQLKELRTRVEKLEASKDNTD